MRKNVTLVAATIAMIAGGTASAQLQNGNFELAGFPDIFLNWNQFGGNISADTFENVIEGFASVKMFGDFSGGFNNKGVFQNVGGVQAGDLWRATISASHLPGDALAGPNNLIVSLVYVDSITGQGNLLDTPVDVLTAASPTGTVLTVSTEAVAPYGVNEAQIVIVFNQPDGLSPGAAYFDLASLERVSSGNDIPFYNGGFEEASPFQQAYDGWAEFSAGFNLQRLFAGTGADPVNPADDIVPFEGEALASIFGQFNGAVNDSGIFQDQTAEAGQNWEASVMLRNPGFDSIGGANFITLSLQFLDASGGVIVDNAQMIADATTPTDQWLERSVSATAPEGTARARITLVYTQPEFAGGAVWIDAANLALATGPMGCNAADLSEAFGTLDINDILVFAGAFNANDPSADFFADGMFDINDILTFAGAFNAGCP